MAYLAVEILILPEAGYRWLVAAGMGVFHGIYFGSFLQQSEMDSLYVLTGVVRQRRWWCCCLDTWHRS